MAVRRGTGLQFGCFSIVRARDEGCLVLTIPLYVRHTNPKSSIRRGGKKNTADFPRGQSTYEDWYF